jgi:predicted flap endonuclease-1-like 5' DNA nuclease
MVTRPILAALLALFCLFGIGLLVILIILLRGSRRKGHVEEPPPPPPDIEDKTVEYETPSVTPDKLETRQPPAEDAWWEITSDDSLVVTEEPADFAPEVVEEFPLAEAASLGAAAWAISSISAEEAPSQPEAGPETESKSIETIPITPTLDTDEDYWQVTSDEELSQLEPEAVSAPLPDEDISAVPPLAIEETPELDHEAEVPVALTPIVEETPQLDYEAETPIAPEPITEETSELDYEAESVLDVVAKFKRDLTYVEGIGEVYAQKLAQSNILTLKDLLEKGATPKGRQEIAEASGITPKLILKWVNHVDLFRIKGVGQEYADLLEWSGVDTVVELATRNPEHLLDKMISVNEEKSLVRKPPVLPQVQSWVEQAKHLPRVIYY